MLSSNSSYSEQTAKRFRWLTRCSKKWSQYFSLSFFHRLFSAQKMDSVASLRIVWEFICSLNASIQFESNIDFNTLSYNLKDMGISTCLLWSNGASKSTFWIHQRNTSTRITHTHIWIRDFIGVICNIDAMRCRAMHSLTIHSIAEVTLIVCYFSEFRTINFVFGNG